jgi:hypothetical protein
LSKKNALLGPYSQGCLTERAECLALSAGESELALNLSCRGPGTQVLVRFRHSSWARPRLAPPAGPGPGWAGQRKFGQALSFATS